MFSLEMLFIPFKFIDAIDIILVAFLIFELYMLLKGTIAINIFIGILSVYLLWFLVSALNMQLLSTILGQFIGVGVIALLIVFQQELRRFLLIIGTRGFFSKENIITKLLGKKRNVKEAEEINLSPIVKACLNMKKTKTGALIVLAKSSELKFYSKTGTELNARLNSELLEAIFFKNNPLHDGATIIVRNTITSARCILPVAEDSKFPETLGFRHRAAVGMSQNTDSVVIIVSEEKGEISLAFNGRLFKVEESTFESKLKQLLA